MTTPTNLPQTVIQDSADLTKVKFNEFGTSADEFSAVEYDLTHSFFELYGFSHDAATAVASTLLKQAKLGYKYIISSTGDVSIIMGNGMPTPIFVILDTLKIVADTNELALSELVGGILNSNRTLTSILGFKRTHDTSNIARNIAA